MNERVSVPLSPDLRRFAEQAAAAEDRSIAGWVRRLIAEAARRASAPQQREAA